jgi:DNA polymerase phi
MEQSLSTALPPSDKNNDHESQTTTDVPIVSTNTASTLTFYWSLASVDASVRITAAHDLIKTLVKLQEDHDETLSQENKIMWEGEMPQNLEKRCPPDVSYAIKRLIRGLPSSRDGARQGFSLALTQLLSSLNFINAKTVLQLLDSFTQTTGGMKGQVWFYF